jgi:hypothetical protein
MNNSVSLVDANRSCHCWNKIQNECVEFGGSLVKNLHPSWKIRTRGQTGLECLFHDVDSPRYCMSFIGGHILCMTSAMHFTTNAPKTKPTQDTVHEYQRIPSCVGISHCSQWQQGLLLYHSSGTIIALCDSNHHGDVYYHLTTNGLSCFEGHGPLEVLHFFGVKKWYVLSLSRSTIFSLLRSEVVW